MPTEKKILIVDDEEFLRQSLASVLRFRGCEVTGVPDGKTALEALQLCSYDLILLDLILPSQNGLELLPVIHALYSDIPILIFAAAVTEDKAKQALQLGARGLIFKPIDPVELIQQIQTILGN